MARDVRELVDGFLGDLGLQPLSADDAIRSVIAGIAAQVVAGEIAPENGADEIWRLAAPLPMDDRPKGLIGLASQWEDSPKVRDAEVRADIVQAALEHIALWQEEFPSLPLP